MCGVAGVLKFDNADGRFHITTSYLERMRDVMIHRGPDGAGLWIDSDARIGLAHRRLAIIDRSENASQPMSNADQTMWITYNGEIYNHAEIRAELESLGRYSWKTDHSDTEVLLHAFEQWGIECVHKFRGMFAFAIWDTKQKALWLVRDRIGIKPLYYSFHNNRVTFASEIKALLTDPHQLRQVNEKSVYQYLSFLTSAPPETMFAGIEKVAPASWIRIASNGEVKEARYWDVLEHVTPLVSETDEQIAEQLIEELRRSVNFRKVSDVPVGVFLSGGLDSSANASLFSEEQIEPVKTFTVEYDENYAAYPTEVQYARSMARSVGADHYECKLNSEDLAGFIPKMIWLQDEPLGDPVCFPLYYVSKLARENGVAVCQVGEGADELFWGYPPWRRMVRLENLNKWPVPRYLKGLGAHALGAFGHEGTSYHEWLRRGANGTAIFWGGTDAIVEAEKKKLISPRLRSQFADLTGWDVIAPIYERFNARAWDNSAVNWISYCDLSLRLPELMLMRVDKMSMGVSLEARVPFLDHEFVQLAMSIPGNVKTREGNLKYILKKAVRGIIPDELIDRKKQGFHAPVHEWFLGKLGAIVRQELNFFCRESDLLDPKSVNEFLDSGRGMQVWYLYNLAIWWRTYIYGDGRQPCQLLAD